MNKQIEEMGREIAYNVAWDEDELQTVDCLETAKRLYNAGYRKQGEWIPVPERLPEKTGKYLVYGRGNCYQESKIWICGCISIGNVVGWCNDAHNPIVTHWMPLPEPPEAEKGGAD